MAFKSRSSVESAQIKLLIAELRKRPGQYLRASELKSVTGVAKNWVRRLLEGQGEVKIIGGPPYEYCWVDPQKLGRQ